MQYFSPYILSFVVIFLNQFTFSEFHESSTHHDVKLTSSALNKIERSVDTKLQQKKSELADIQRCMRICWHQLLNQSRVELGY